MRPFAGCELLREVADHGPLIGAGILGFVDKDVVNAAIKSEQDPLRNQGVSKQRARLANLIVETQHSAAQLGILKAGDEFRREIIKRARLFKGNKR